jgi:hypothetical protein
MATKKKTGKKKHAVGECPNPDKAYTLWGLIAKLQDKDFAVFFLDLLKRAEANEPGTIECVDSYLAPTPQELQNLGIPASQVASMRKCTDSGLLVLVTAQLKVSSRGK